MEDEWNAMMEKYKLRDWRYPQQMRTDERSASVESVDDQEQEAAAALEDMGRPPYTYSELAAMAIRNSPEQRCTVQDICHFVEIHFPYYRGWNIKAAKASFASVLYARSDFVKTTDFERREDGHRRHYYSFRPSGKKKCTIRKPTV